ELETIAPALVGINRQMPYSIPVGYFELFEVNPAGKDTPVVQLHPKRSIMKWAVAASVIAIAGLFAWQYLWHSPATITTQPVATTENTGSTDTLQLGAALAALADTSIHMALDESGMLSDSWSALYYLNTEN